MNEIQFKAPKGATHYYKNEFNTSYWFYSVDVNMWFVWSSYRNYWASNIFNERVAELKPL